MKAAVEQMKKMSGKRTTSYVFKSCDSEVGEEDGEDGEQSESLTRNATN